MNQPYVYIHPLSLEPPSYPSSHRSRSPQSTELSSLCYTSASHELCFTYGSVYMTVLLSQLFHPLLPPLCPQVHSLCLCLYSCPAKRFICTIFSRFCINALLLLLSHVSCVWLCATPWMAAHQAPPSLEFSRQEHWSGCHFLLQCKKVKSESEVAQLCPTLRDPWTTAYQAPPSMRFPRQEHWSGLPLPSPIYVLIYDICFLVFSI